METGDKVLVLLAAKVACCLGLTLAATGALGGVGMRLLEGAGRCVVGAVLVGLIAALVLDRPYRTETTASAEARVDPAPKLLEPRR